MFGVTFQPSHVGWHYRGGTWQAACSGDTRQAVARALRQRYGDDAAVQVLPCGEIPTKPPIRDEDVSFEVPSYGRQLRA